MHVTTYLYGMYWRRARWTRPTLPLMHSDVRRCRSSVLAEAAPVRLLAAVAALVHSNDRRRSGSVLAEPTPESLHSRRASRVVVVVAVCSTHTSWSQLTPTHHPTLYTYHSTTRSVPASRPRFTPRGIAKYHNAPVYSVFPLTPPQTSKRCQNGSKPSLSAVRLSRSRRRTH